MSTLNTNCFFSAQEAGVFQYFTGSLSITANSRCSQAKWRPPIQPSPENRPNNPGNTCFCVLYMHLQCAGQRWSFFDLYAHCEMRAANVALSHWEEEEKQLKKRAEISTGCSCYSLWTARTNAVDLSKKKSLLVVAMPMTLFLRVMCHLWILYYWFWSWSRCSSFSLGMKGNVIFFHPATL